MSSYVTSCALCHVMSRYVVLCHVINPDLSNFNLTSPTGLTVKRHRNFIIPALCQTGRTTAYDSRCNQSPSTKGYIAFRDEKK